MNRMLRTLYLFLLLIVSACTAQSNNTSNLPETFKKTIPVELKGGLSLVEVKNRCDGCEPWRYIDFYSNTSKEPIKREKVTVQAGYRAMYAYPDTHYFSNTKIEQSTSGAYENDKKTVVDAIKHEYARKKERIAGYLKENPNIKKRWSHFVQRAKSTLIWKRTRTKVSNISRTPRTLSA